MAIRDEEPTCEERAEQELCEREDCYDTFCSQPNVQQLQDEFWPTSQPRQLEAADLLYLTALCPDFRTNGAATVCACDDGDSKCGCRSEVRNGCDDPDKCPNRNYGMDLVVLLKAALHSMSLAYIPVAGLEYPDPTNPCWELEPGTVLVFDPNATPQNRTWDDCKPKVGGAFVPTDIKTIVAECLAELGEE